MRSFFCWLVVPIPGLLLAVMLMWMTGCAHVATIPAHTTRPVETPVFVLAQDLSENQQQALLWAILHVDCIVGYPVLSDMWEASKSTVVVVDKGEIYPLNGYWEQRSKTVVLANRHRGQTVEWLVSLLVHEFGHVLGLKDTSWDGDVMNRTLPSHQANASWHPLELTENQAQAIRKLHQLPPPDYDTSKCSEWVERQAALLGFGGYR